MRGSFCHDGAVEKINFGGPAPGDVLEHGRVVPGGGRELDIMEVREIFIGRSPTGGGPLRHG